MKIKKRAALWACLFLFAGLLTTPALALDSGVYTADVITSYYNPDTGNIDDGGTANAALGEGMCRSATGAAALVEVHGEDIWITIRLLLQSNCKNVVFYTRTGYDSYSKVNYTVTAEDSANDSVDFRFKVSDAGVKLKCTMYVTPMGRDVLWYLYLDTSILAAGSGDFVVNIDTGPEDSAASSTTSIKESSVDGTGTPAQPETEAGPVDDQQDAGPALNAGQAPGSTPADGETGNAEPEQAAGELEGAESAAGEPGTSELAAGEQESSAFSDEIGSVNSGSGGMMAGIIAAVILAGGVTVAVVRGRRKV